jgi:ABC-type antimicrobial peptide transport system permease subunit
MHILKPPSWQEGGDWRFVLGTDRVGRDILSQAHLRSELFARSSASSSSTISHAARA